MYNLALCAGGAIAMPWVLFKLLTRERWRRGLGERSTLRLPEVDPARARVWVHAASAGEMVAAAPFVERLLARHPHLEVVVSSMTVAGIEVARRRLPGQRAFLFPLDLLPLARRLLRRIEPRALVLFELELWPSMMAACEAESVAVVVANGRIGERSARRMRFAPIRRLLGADRVALFSMQSEEHRQRLRALGIADARIAVQGNLKIDAAGAAGPGREAMRAALGIEADERLVVAGSTHAGEETLVARAVATLSRVRLVVAPRHRERLADAERDLERAGFEPLRLTRWRAGDRAEGSRPTALVVDTMGELTGIYAAADAVVVGGSLVPGVGGHNVFEPALAGAPAVIGPWHKNVRSDVLHLSAAGAIAVCERPESLAGELAAILGGHGEAMTRAAAAAVAAGRGAADRTIDRMEQSCPGVFSPDEVRREPRPGSDP